MVTTRKKGIKLSLLDLKAGESVTFERKRYSSLRSMVSVIKIEYPERAFVFEILEDCIRITCEK